MLRFDVETISIATHTIITSRTITLRFDVETINEITCKTGRNIFVTKI